MLGPSDSPRPDRIGALLTLYQYTAQASAEATAAVSDAAAAAGLPHRTRLPDIHAAHHRDQELPEATGQLTEAQSVYEPGRIERTLRGLDITDAELLRRAGDIDRAAEQLITQAAAQQEAHPTGPHSGGMHAQAARDAERHGRRAVQAEEAEAEP